MDDAQRQALERTLAGREEELQAAVGRLREALAAPSSVADAHDPVEEGDARMMASLDLAQLGRLEDELREVLAARQRQRDGVYGLCEACGEPIAVERLQVLPEARLCLRDEEAAERAQAGR